MTHVDVYISSVSPARDEELRLYVMLETTMESTHFLAMNISMSTEREDSPVF